MKTLFLFAVLFAVANLYTYDLGYNFDYKIGDCVGGGWIWCSKADPDNYLNYERYETTDWNPESRCETCNDCDGVYWSDFACTYLYAHEYYSFMAGTFKTDRCGSFIDPIEIQASADATDASVVATLSGLESGDSCFYIMKNACGGGSFSVDQSSVSGMIFYVLESDEGSADYTVDPYTGQGESSFSTTRQSGVAVEGMAPRDTAFDGSWGSSDGEGDVVFPSAGNRAMEVATAHSWGNSNDVAGLPVRADPLNDCLDRQMYVVAVAYENDAAATIEFSVNAEFSNARALAAVLMTSLFAVLATML